MRSSGIKVFERIMKKNEYFSNSRNIPTTYTAPIVGQSYILGSVYPEVARALSAFEMIDFNTNQRSPKPDSFNNSSSEYYYKPKNSNFILFLFGMLIGGGILYISIKRNEEMCERNQLDGITTPTTPSAVISASTITAKS